MKSVPVCPVMEFKMVHTERLLIDEKTVSLRLVSRLMKWEQNSACCVSGHTPAGVDTLLSR